MWRSIFIFAVLQVTFTPSNAKSFQNCASARQNCIPPGLPLHFPIGLPKKPRGNLRFEQKSKYDSSRPKQLMFSGAGTEVSKVEEVCNGYENFMHDLEIGALILTTISFGKSIFALTLHILNQAYIFFSVHIIGTPERLAWLIEQIQETMGSNLGTIIETIGFLDYLGIRWISFPVGNLIVIIDVISHIMGGISLIIDWIVPFRGIFRNTVLQVTGIDLEREFDGYGCHNPLEATVESMIRNILLSLF